MLFLCILVNRYFCAIKPNVQHIGEVARAQQGRGPFGGAARRSAAEPGGARTGAGAPMCRYVTALAIAALQY